MDRATANYFAETRNQAAWQARGLFALYGFGLASLIAAVVTFIAHNWTYLGTGMKLGGLGLALIICASIWMIRGFDRTAAHSFGIAAQVLIGVWLAAAGQFYQAPGGLQDLLLTWAVLGLPFALASRSAVHWAVWFSIIWLAAMSPMGLKLLAFIDADWSCLVMLIGALILIIGIGGGLKLRAHLWFRVFLAVGVGTLCIAASWIGLVMEVWLGGYGPSLIALVVMGGIISLTYANRTVSTTAILAAAIMVIGVSALGFAIGNAIDEGVIIAFIMTAIVGGATYALVLFFKHLRCFNADDPSGGAVDDHRHWYMEAFIGVGGVVTAISACGLIATVIGFSGVMEKNWELSLLIIGIFVYGSSLWLRRAESGQFLRFLLGTFILAGIACTALGVGGLANDTMAAGLSLLALSILTAWLIDDDKILAALMAAAACLSIALIVDGLSNHTVQIALLLSLYTAIGLALGTVFLRERVRTGLAAVFLIAALMTGLVIDNGLDPLGRNGVIILRSVEAGIGIIGAAWLWFSYGRAAGPSLPVLIALVLIAIILPIGAVPAMLLLLLAYMIGSKPLFLIGVMAMIWFSFSAYFDLSVTLMALSVVMALVGAGLLGLWALAKQRLDTAS